MNATGQKVYALENTVNTLGAILEQQRCADPLTPNKRTEGFAARATADKKSMFGFSKA